MALNSAGGAVFEVAVPCRRLLLKLTAVELLAPLAGSYPIFMSLLMSNILGGGRVKGGNGLLCFISAHSLGAFEFF